MGGWQLDFVVDAGFIPRCRGSDKALHENRRPAKYSLDQYLDGIGWNFAQSRVIFKILGYVELMG